jgi:hypothetical protein
MSNLGAYQWMTKTAKKVGGPANLLLLAGVAGAGIYKVGEVTVKKVVKRKRTNKRENLRTGVYIVSTPGRSNDGVEFIKGEQFRVLERDGDAILIEKLHDKNNPYFVSAELLRSISDYN